MRTLRALSVLLPLANTHAATTPFCKRDPSSPDWPSASQWQALNVSVAGTLQVPTAPASICHPGRPDYNNDTCTTLLANWTSTDWVAHSPWVVDYNDDTCLPSSAAPCSTAGYPAYVIEASTTSDVVAGVNFARDNQVRLVIKGTGHDWPGRSSGPGALSIWTHNLQGIQVIMDDPKAVQYGGIAAVKISAGMRMGEIYAEAAKNNLTIVGGADHGVGIGGWISSGGHGPVTSKYGMGADQVLEMEVVTADGQLLTVNETSNEDLFWALRGGGPSTFAVLLSVTVKAYPPLPIADYTFAYNTTSDSDTFWSMLAHFHADLPRISEAGGMGYYFVLPATGSSSEPQGQIAGGWIFPERTAAEVREIMEPLEAILNNGSSWATDKIVAGGIVSTEPDFTTAWLQMQPQTGGVDGRLGSWLLDGPSLTNNLEYNAAQLRSNSIPQVPMLGHLVAGPGTHSVTIPGGSSAVLPAWRKAYTHFVNIRSWTPLNYTLKSAATKDLRDKVVPTLTSLAPDSGAYVNEADPTNPNWKNDYYGANYDRLLEVKHKWDPEGVFWCKPCVGHDEWEVMDGPTNEDPENWGVSQVGGKICRTQ